ncbi:MAG: hypothetical protein ABIJ84_00170, partial [bacterium]
MVRIISKETGTDPDEIYKDFRDVRKQYLKQKGSAADPDVIDMAELGLTAMIVPVLAVAPAATATAIAGFMVVDKGLREAINLAKSVATGQKYDFGAIKDYSDILPEDVNQVTKDLVDIIGFLGSAKVVSKGYKLIGNKMPGVVEKLTKNVIEKYNLPRKIYINSKEVRSLFIDSKDISKQKAEILTNLGLDAAGYKKGIRDGLEIELSAEKITTLVDKSYWTKLKKIFHVKPTQPITKRMFVDKSTVSETITRPERILPEGKIILPAGRVAPTTMDTPRPTEKVILPKRISPTGIATQEKIRKGAEKLLKTQNIDIVPTLEGSPSQKYLWHAINRPIDQFGKNKLDDYIDSLKNSSASVVLQKDFGESMDSLIKRKPELGKRIKDNSRIIKFIQDNKSQLIDSYKQVVKEKGATERVAPKQPVVEEKTKPLIVPKELESFKSAEEFVAANHFERISNEIISGKIKKTDIPSIIDQEDEFRGLFKRNGETFVTEGAGAIWSVYYSQIHERGLTPMKAFKEVELLFDLNAKTKSQLTDEVSKLIYNQAVKEAKSSEVIKEKKLPKQPVVKEEKVERVAPVKAIEAKTELHPKLKIKPTAQEARVRMRLPEQKPTYRGVSTSEWESIKTGNKISSKSVTGRDLGVAYVSETPKMAKGYGELQIEFKPEAIDKMSYQGELRGERKLWGRD